VIRPLSFLDVQRLADELSRPLPPLDIRPVGRYRLERRPPPVVSALIDGAPTVEAATVAAVAEQLASDEQAWFTRHLVEGLQLAGEPATAENLADYGPRLSMRRYPSGVVVVALDAEQLGEGRSTLGRQLFALGEPTVRSYPGPLQITRPILSGQQALAYELSLKKYPPEAFEYGLPAEPADEHHLQQLVRLGFEWSPGMVQASDLL
jgi:hypothetical protein